MDGRIRAILPSGEVGNAGDAQVIDLKGGYLMPGLWDVHIHPDYLSADAMPLADQVTLFGHRMGSALTESGIAACAAPAVNNAITAGSTAIHKARGSAIILGFSTAVALLVGAVAAWYAACGGGRERDSAVPRPAWRLRQQW